ncbi:MAG: ATP-binding protein [Candidatus Aminicenantes bacterium]|nr:ATP-binding protein [Candidatus Aminicenantes bacterium]
MSPDTGKPVEIAVISGKGGTGKTSITAALAVLAENAVVADCDVDAADLHLVLAPEVRQRHEFISGHEAVIRELDCRGCGLCKDYCRYEAIDEVTAKDGRQVFRVDPAACEGCGVCVRFCPVQAIDFPDSHCGEWNISHARTGPMVHARLKPGAENSGKLVSQVRESARAEARSSGRSLILVDGPPGIGCPVIATVTGTTLVLVVVEPTVSGEHDLDRVLGLTRHFNIPAALCVNKWDINPQITQRIEDSARAQGVASLGRIAFDAAMTRAQVRGHTVIDEGGPAAEDIRQLWNNLQEKINS